MTAQNNNNQFSTSVKIGRFVRTYLLFFAIGTGGTIFSLFHFVDALKPLKPIAYFFGNDLLPLLIFSMLYFSFCKVNLKDMRPRQWHIVINLLMLITTAVLSFYLASHVNSPHRALIQGAIMCVIMPPAAAAGVIAGKLGGNEASVVTGILIGNLLCAVAIPLFFPLFTSKLSGGFFEEFMLIAGRIFPVIVLPLLLAFATKLFIKPLHRFIVNKLRGISYYIWAVCLCTVSARTFSCIVNSPENAATLWSMAAIGFVTTFAHFAIGKLVGNLHHQRISAGQAFGQRNGVFGLWVALSFLDPAAVIAPGCYILWQNVMNSWQLAHREKLVARCKDLGILPYQE